MHESARQEQASSGGPMRMALTRAVFRLPGKHTPAKHATHGLCRERSLPGIGGPNFRLAVVCCYATVGKAGCRRHRLHRAAT